MLSSSHRARGSLTQTSTTAALHRGDLKISDPIPFDDSGEGFSRSKLVTQSFHGSDGRANNAIWPRKNSPAPDPHARHVSDAQAYTGARTSLGPSSLPRSMSSMPSKASLDQKKSGRLRAALKRMFSSKRHSSAPTGSKGHEYARAGRLLSAQEQRSEVQAQAGSEPAPPSPFIPREAALTSHSTRQGPDSIEQDLPVLPRRRRRNTLPSLVFSDKSGLEHAINSWSAAGESSPQAKWLKEDYISDGQLNRRSRSADALKELLRKEGVESSTGRDRADEIAYWRNSAIENPVPVYSGQSIAVDPVHVLGPVGSGEEADQERGVVNPMQSFEFGLNGTNGDETSLEQRVNTLEIKLIDFEYAIAKLQGTDISKSTIPSQQFNGGLEHDITLDGDTHPAPTTTSSPVLGYFTSANPPHAFTFLSSPGDSPLPSPETSKLVSPQRASKATTATIRPSTACRTSAWRSGEASPSSVNISTDKFELLMSMIKEEKAAREQLEAQVMSLQGELESMRAPIYATIKEAYPTPSPKSIHNSPSTPRTLHRSPGFQLNHPPPEISRFSGTDPDSDMGGGFGDAYDTSNESRNTFETARGSLERV